jgi:hypothetical protein
MISVMSTDDCSDIQEEDATCTVKTTAAHSENIDTSCTLNNARHKDSEDMTVEQIQEILRRLDGEYRNCLMPKQRMIQNALEQLQREEESLLQQCKAAAEHNLNDRAERKDTAKHVPPSSHLPKPSKRPKQFQQEAAALRLAQALFEEDDDHSSDTSSTN